MNIKALHIINYRNIGQADIDLSSGINCFVGENGAGKTNLLDVIYYLSFCKSFFSPMDNYNIRHDQPFFVLQGTYDLNGQEESIYCGIKRGQKKQFRRGKKDYQRLSDHIGLLPLVIIAPIDEMLIADGAEERRKYTDSVISQTDRIYLESLVEYNHLLQQRNALLKTMMESTSPDLNLLEVFDVKLSERGTVISEGRRKLVEYLEPILNDFYQKLSSNREGVAMKYVTGLQRYDLYEGLVQSRARDLALGYTSRGIHKDDIEFLLDGQSIRRFGSQGQRKSFVLALKLAQYQYLSEMCGVKPMLLLDDIFDKLDKIRGNNLINLLSGNDFDQIFITDTDRNRLTNVLEKTAKEYRVFRVTDGEISVEDKNV